MGDLPWQHFGLPGLVIAALFGLVVFIIRQNNGRFDALEKRHRAERDEWRRSDDQRSRNIEAAMNRIADAINHMRFETTRDPRRSQTPD